LKLLNEHEVRYLVIGGYAVGYYGYPRATNDLDIWIDNEPQNAEKLVQALKRFGFDDKEMKPEIFLIEGQIIRIGHPPIRIELLTSISGVQFDQCYRSRTAGSIDGIEMKLIGLEELKINKKASGRHKDLNDVENLPKE
jgi:predicted nucleotidyltransferase